MGQQNSIQESKNFSQEIKKKMDIESYVSTVDAWNISNIWSITSLSITSLIKSSIGNVF